MQANKKEIKHPILGWVLFKKNARSKQITLRVKSDASIVITLPKQSSYANAEKILHQNIAWVQDEVAKAKDKVAATLLTYGNCFELRGKPLTIVSTNELEASILYEATKIDLFIPNSWDLKQEEVQTTIQNGIVAVLRREGKLYLPNRTRQLAAQKGIVINNVRIKKVKTRWGSCSSKGNINLSLYLMLLPDDLIDYVILHELAHIKHQNHSAAFWNHLEVLLPGAKQFDRALNAYRIPFL